jgi:hypothetical protein
MALPPAGPGDITPKSVTTVRYTNPGVLIPPVPIPEPGTSPTKPFNPVYKPDAPVGVTKPRITVIDKEYGGAIDQHWRRFTLLAFAGDMIEIRGACESACTTIMGAIVKDRICFGKDGYLAFHHARDRAEQVVVSSTQWMIDRMPSDIQGWITAKGGIEKLPVKGYWYLPANELWQMGYRRCVD